MIISSTLRGQHVTHPPISDLLLPVIHSVVHLFHYLSLMMSSSFQI
jgi:hypothetical protein